MADVDGRVRCVVVTPETTVLDAAADFVAIPAYDGEVGISPGRAPLVARLGIGELRLGKGDSARRYFVDGGFGQVKDDVVTILTPRSRPADQLEAAALEKQLAEARGETPAGDDAIDEKLRRLDRLRAQLRLARGK